MSQKIDMIGKQYNALIVLEEAEKGRYLCSCSCGNELVVRGDSLRSGNTKSCGCLRKANAGRPQGQDKNTPEACIELHTFVNAMQAHFSPLRHYLKAQGVVVGLEGYYTVNEIQYGPFETPVHALAHAMLHTIKSE